MESARKRGVRAPLIEAELWKEEVRALSQALSLITDDQRAAIVLYDVEGYDYLEIAEMTGVSLGTVKSRLSRARARLRDLLLEHGELLPAGYRLQNEGV